MRIEITFGQLTAWLVAGVAEIGPADLVRAPADTPGDDNTSFSRVRLSVGLPNKYATAGSQPVIALADEIDNVSAATLELTRETGSRLANQGEGWVPVAHVEWPPAMPAAAVAEQIIPGAEAQPAPLPDAPIKQVELIGDAPTSTAENVGPAPRRTSRSKKSAAAVLPPAKPKRAAKKRAAEAELPLDGGLEEKP
ncbi:MAG: hypothetical protein ABIQ99_11105 [Thermoflexales bacterium]